MIKTVIMKNNYQDSINLMLLTNKINEFDNVKMSQVMMGTDANKDILNNTNLLTDEANGAAPSDLMIVVDSDDDIMDDILKTVDEFLSDLSSKNEGEEKNQVSTSWEEALEKAPDANLAVFSIPGEYAVSEMKKALNNDLHVFSFTDNIPVSDEIELKQLAHEKGLLMMGPDCGTGIFNGVPIAFTNKVKSGNIGVVGASGTGIQEVTTLIDKLGGGVANAIGTGGRDLKEEVGAITVKDGITALENDPLTDVICVISKPPAKSVRDEVVKMLQSLSKPAVAIFLGEKPHEHIGNVHFAYTLEEAAQIAVDLSNKVNIKELYDIKPANDATEVINNDLVVKGLYSGGTLASEASMIISDALNIDNSKGIDGYILNSDGYEIIDLGDDVYTQGKPHPMMDPDVRVEKIMDMAKKAETGVILFDVVLGYGAHEDMANVLVSAINEAKEVNKNIKFIATICGSKLDFQNYDYTIKLLQDNGVLVEESNAKAVLLALKFKGVNVEFNSKSLVSYNGEKVTIGTTSEKVSNLLTGSINVINVGLDSFNRSVLENNGKSHQYNWRPRASGNKKMIQILDALEQYDEVINEENLKVINKMKDAQPFLVDVVRAKDVISELNTDQKTILHAGPPITWSEMTGPMQGSCIGAVLFEDWASTEEEALKLLENDGVRFMPCHHVDAVGPMGGITSANMAVVIVENRLTNNRAYCTLNEGIGKVLRFGAYSQEVVDRLHWMKDILGPTLQKAIKLKEDGINLNVMIAKSITMGDEFHQRNIAASLNFLKEVSPLITKLDMDENDKYDVIKFLADTDQFFLNIMMATGKAIMDGARKDSKGTVVTTLTRNGVNFGVRVAQTGDEWFTDGVNTPNGLYFTGFSSEDANPDIGDSAITETVGVGAMAMIAAPGVTRFVGAGGFKDALDISEEMAKICISHNPTFTIPTWDFKGTCLGIDIRKVVETGITPLINTGIAHKKAGLGQVGAGTVRAPLGCFEKALEAYAKDLGIIIED